MSSFMSFCGLTKIGVYAKPCEFMKNVHEPQTFENSRIALFGVSELKPCYLIASGSGVRSRKRCHKSTISLAPPFSLRKMVALPVQQASNKDGTSLSSDENGTSASVEAHAASSCSPDAQVALLHPSTAQASKQENDVSEYVCPNMCAELKRSRSNHHKKTISLHLRRFLWLVRLLRFKHVMHKTGFPFL